MAGHITVVLPTLSQTTVAIGPPFILLTFEQVFKNSLTRLPMGGGRAVRTGAKTRRRRFLAKQNRGFCG
jgi:glutamate dehydrogenase/leucine dehydrogenase